jgi:hypothetical protein
MAAGNTYVALATNTLSSATASVTFSSISGAYTDLVLITNVKATSGTPTIRMQFNSDTGSNYSTTLIYGDGSSAGSVRVTNEASTNSGGLANEFGNTIFNLNNYSNSTTYKTILTRYNFIGSYSETGAKVSLWRNTAAITSILVFPASSTFASGSTFTLYGIAAA